MYEGSQIYEATGSNLTLKGEEIDVIARKVVLPGSGKDLSRVLTAIVDLTEIHRAQKEREELESQLRQAQKMEAVGTLAGGIAHDFNNILAAILGYTELALMDVPQGAQLHENLAEIRKAGMRAKDLVQQILAFSRKAEERKRPIRLAPIIKEALKMLRASIPVTVDIRSRLDIEEDTVLADPTQIHQIMMNLCTNAAHAMENGGILDVSLKGFHQGEGMESAFAALPPGDYLHMRVSDTGRGIPPELLEKIFDPYFTTKDKGSGTGLGLAVVHGIVTSLGGAMFVQSEMGKGSTFDIVLPKAATGTSDLLSEENREPAYGNERILFVDDEESVIRVGRQMLERLGYTVTAFSNPLEALKVFKDAPDAFDLIVTDMTMPDMTGDRFASEVMTVRPDAPVILCTGYSERITEDEAEKMGIKAFAMKPLAIRELAATVRRVLDGN